MAFPKLPDMESLSKLLASLKAIDVDAISKKIDEFVLAAKIVQQTCARIETQCIRTERKLDAVIAAAEIKVDDVNSSSSGDSCRAAVIAISGRNA